MRAILIDPVDKTVTEVKYSGDYKEIYTLLSNPVAGLVVDTFTVVRIAEHESIFVDDEGLLKEPEYFFKWEDYGQPLAGLGLILGDDAEGESVGTELTLDFVKSKVTFPNVRLESMESVEGETEMFGVRVPFIGSRPIFRKVEEDE